MAWASVVALSLFIVTIGANSCLQDTPNAYAGSTNFYSFGINFKGNLGYDQNNTVQPVSISIGSSRTPVFGKCTGGFMHTAVIVKGTGATPNQVYCAGDSTGGQCALGPAYLTKITRFTRPAEKVPANAAIALDDNIADVCTGFSHTCAIFGDGLTTGTIWCAGQHTKGQLGIGSEASEFSLFRPTLGADRTSSGVRQDAAFQTLCFKSVSCGGDFVVAVTCDGSAAYSWGANDAGQLGLGSASASIVKLASKITFPNFGTSDQILEVATGYAFTIVRTTTTFYFMGSNAEKQLGIPTLGAINKSPIANDLAGLALNTVAVKAGGYHTVLIVRESNGIGGSAQRVYTCGEGTLGGTGHPQPADKIRQRWFIDTFTQVATLKDVAAYKIAAGFKHTLVLDNCGAVWTFGSDAFGQLGGGGGKEATNFRTLLPTVVPRVATWSLQVTDICAGYFSSHLVTKLIS